MPNMVVIPPAASPWQQNLEQLSQFLSLMALKKIDQKFRAEELQQQAARQETEFNRRLFLEKQLQGYETIPTSETVREGMPAGAVNVPGQGTLMRPTPQDVEGYQAIKEIPGVQYVKKPGPPTLAELGYYNIEGQGLYKLTGTELRKFSGPQITHLRPTTDANGVTVYPAVDRQTGARMQDFDITVRGKPMRSGEPDTAAALKRLSEISRQRAGFTKVNEVTQAVIVANPDLAPFMGQTLSPEDKQKLFDSWDREATYLNQFVPSTLKTPAPGTGPALGTQLPEGLTESDVQFNMKKYGKSRADVINRYRQRGGQ